MALITSSHNSVASFLTEATSLGLRVQEMLELRPDQENIGLAVETFIRSLARPRPVVALVLQAEDVEAVAEHLKNIQLSSSPVWLLGSLGLELRSLRTWRTVFRGGILVEPHLPQLREFKEFFLRSLQAPDILTNTLEEYLAETTGCTTPGKDRPYRVELSHWSRSVQILSSDWLTPDFAGTKVTPQCKCNVVMA